MKFATYPKSSDAANGEGVVSPPRVHEYFVIQPAQHFEKCWHIEDVAQRSLDRLPEAWGKMRNAMPRESRSYARLRCCHNGARPCTRRRGNSSARAALSRNLLRTMLSIPAAATPVGRLRWIQHQHLGIGRRYRLWKSQNEAVIRPQHFNVHMPAARSRPLIAIAQGAWMRLPNGVNTQTRQSPSSSRTRSTTMVRSSGTSVVAIS